MNPVRLGSLFGIPFELRPSFLLLLLFIVVSSIVEQSMAAFIGTMIFVSVVWGTVTLHELGHCWMAKKVGWKCKSIGLWLLGGVAHVTLNPFEPKKELKVAIAGPAVNVLLIWLFWPLAVIFNSGVWHVLTLWFLQFNLILIVFNLIPALPLDGGRVLRSVLAMKSGDVVWATKFCRNLAYALALLMFPLIIYNPFMLLICGFIILAATQEYNYVRICDRVFKEAKERCYECELPSIEEFIKLQHEKQSKEQS